MRQPSRSPALGLSFGLVALSSALGCAGEVTPSTPVVQVEVAAAPKPVETRFRGRLSFVGAGLARTSTHQEAGEQAVQRHLGEVLQCLGTEKPEKLTAWTVGRFEQGKAHGLKSSPLGSQAATKCVESVLAKIEDGAQEPVAFSVTFVAEPAPADCKGDECTRMAPPTIDRRTALQEAQAYGMLGLLDSGESGSVQGTITGDGLGVGSIGPVGRGGGTGTGQGFGNGNGSLGGSHRAKPPTVRMGATSTTPGLAPEAIQRVVRQNFPSFRFCYEKALVKNPALEGNVAVNFVIAVDGSVSLATNAGSTLADSDTVDCVVGTFKRLSFPAPKSIVKVTYPIHFSPGDSGPVPTTAPATPPPVLSVGGVGFGDLDAAKVAAKLESKGWTTMAVEGTSAGAPFTVFAVRRFDGKDAEPGQSNPVTSVTRLPDTVPPSGQTVRVSEGFELVGDGAGPMQALNDLLD